MYKHPKLIAEIVDNHGGDMRLAKGLVRILTTVGIELEKDVIDTQDHIMPAFILETKGTI